MIELKIFNLKRLIKPNTTTLWAWCSVVAMGWGVGSVDARGDLLQLADGSPPVAGRLIEENSREVKFQTWDPTDRTPVTTYPAALVQRVIRTIDPATLEPLPGQPPSETLRVAETLLAITPDAAAVACGQGLLRDLLQREDLEPAVRRAVERLQADSLRPGLARARSQLALHLAGLRIDPVEVQTATDPWVWYLERVDEAIKAEWREALRQDREPPAQSPPAQLPPAQSPRAMSSPTTALPAGVPRQHLRAALSRAEQAWPATDPRADWCRQMQASLAVDDYSALLTILRLELLLQPASQPGRPKASAGVR
jgi:hypothetical protein